MFDTTSAPRIAAAIVSGVGLRDDFCAKAVQLVAEYAPEPPFDAGTQASAPPEATQIVTRMFDPFLDRIRRAADEAARRMPT